MFSLRRTSSSTLRSPPLLHLLLRYSGDNTATTSNYHFSHTPTLITIPTETLINPIQSFCSKDPSLLWDFGFNKRCLSSAAGANTDADEENFPDQSDAEADNDAEKDMGSVVSEGTDEEEADADKEILTDHLDQSNAEADNYEGKKMGSDVSEEADESGVTLSRSQPKTSKLYEIIMSVPPFKVKESLYKYAIQNAKEGKELDRAMVLRTMRILHKNRLYLNANLFGEWLEETEGLVNEQEYVYRIHAISRAAKRQEVESYFRKIPMQFRKEKVYDAMLHSWVREFKDQSKAVELFEEMKLLGVVSEHACTQMMDLYFHEKSKLTSILKYMEENNIKATLSTYKMLIKVKGKDVKGVEMLFEEMKANDIEPGFELQSIIAKTYVTAGKKSKAEEMVKDIELKYHDQKDFCRTLMPLYAELGKADAVERLWSNCDKGGGSRLEHYAVLEAFAKLGKMEDVEEIFNSMSSKWKCNSYHIILKAYLDKKLLDKAKDVAKTILSTGFAVNPRVWELLLKFYKQNKDVEKMDVVLQKMHEARVKPSYFDYAIVMEAYSKKGDIDNTEKIFHRIGQAGHYIDTACYNLLLQAYINAKAPAYGLRSRIESHKVHINNDLRAMLEKIDSFKNKV